MKTFGFRKKESRFSKWKIYFQNINIVFVLLIFISFSLFSWYNKFLNFAKAEDKQSFLQKNIKELAYTTWFDDPQLSRFLLSVNKLIKTYKNGGYVLSKENKGNLSFVLNYFQNNYKKLNSIGLNEYDNFFKFISNILNYREEIFSLLGENEKKNYIVLLQNSGEARPNGGFFGSFALISIYKGKITNFEVIDSYKLRHDADKEIYVKTPKWMENIIKKQKVRFISANSYGFSNIDGRNIEKLYEKAYDKDIDGVFFLDTQVLADIIPGLKEKFWKWQFVNASIDLIRGDDKPNKKERYLEGVNKYIKNNKLSIIKSVLKNFDKFKNNQSTNIYFSSISKELKNFFQENKLTTNYQKDTLYMWDYNIAFNKVDRFVEKSYEILNSSGDIVKKGGNNVVGIKSLEKGNKYKLRISYNLNIPSYYKEYIKELEDEYSINLTERERHILSMDLEWKNKGVLYFPKDTKIQEINGDLFKSKKFETGFSNNLLYKIKSKENNSLNYIEVSFKLGK